MHDLFADTSGWGHLRILRPTVIAFIESLRTSPYVEIVHIDVSIDEQAWQLLKSRQDKEWSLADAESPHRLDNLDARRAMPPSPADLVAPIEQALATLPADNNDYAALAALCNQIRQGRIRTVAGPQIDAVHAARDANIATTPVMVYQLSGDADSAHLAAYYGATPDASAEARILQRLRARQNTFLPFDDRAATAYGAMRASLEAQGTPIGALDALLAAQAVSYQLIFVTNNVWEFARAPGLTVEDWTTP